VNALPVSPGSSPPHVLVEPLFAGAGPYWEALAVALGGAEGPPSLTELEHFLRSARLREVRAEPVWRTTLGGDRVGAVVALEAPGSSALLAIGPGAAAHPDALRALVGSACDDLRGRGVRLVQTLLAEDDLAGQRVLHEAGHTFLTQLLYLERPARMPPPLRRARANLQWRPYAPELRAVLVRLLDATYVDSQDCRALAGIRSTDDVLTGHAHAADSGTAHWWLAVYGGEPVGALLLGRHGRGDVVEVVYMGVAAGARRRGTAHAMMLHAVHEARAMGARCISLAVDRANGPARRLYADWGFEPVGRRDAWIAVLGATGS